MRRQRRRDIEDENERPTNDAGERCWLLAGSMLARWNNAAGFRPQENEDDIDDNNEDLEMEEIIGN